MERDDKCPFDPPPGLREGRPLRRMVYPDGHVGWLATGHAVVRAVLSDSRFSSRHELIHEPIAGMEGPGGERDAAPIGDMTGIDPPEHTRFRQLLVGKFTVRRMRLLTQRMEEIARDQLDVMAEHGAPADLWTLFAQPVPALMLCELLGVPLDDLDTFQRHTQTALTQDGRPEEVGMAFRSLYGYMRKLVAAKRAEPTDDLLSDLTETDLTDAELAGISVLLLVAGLDTTASVIGLGTFALLRNPDQLAAVRDDPSRIDDVVEELLRYTSVAPRAVRAALEDVELDGQVIKAGESVTVSIEAADRDPERFPDPNKIDVFRQASGHLAFGHGIHQCLGSQLARMELRAAFPALLERFPSLRLAVPAEEVPLRANMSVFGVRELPVVW
ncbi:cytochrome P450 [Streptomyces reniochalinae]|uniref:Cytochrome P450 n=2 Tax=Streptomyces reniochalinae TaxID=2250578 RepID=A0A367EEL6_9ACTN|nr:cytochrome P450 [Streptomyces reniochalinae]RCG16182.1 cytochrome P450 [Streptomyces reniochalinae]